MNLFLDTEFTGLHKNSELISLGICSSDGYKFYAEFTDYMPTAWEDDRIWLNENVFQNLGKPVHELCEYVRGSRRDVRIALENWLSELSGQYGEGFLNVWTKTGQYDWVLFQDLWNHAFLTPKCLPYRPFDMETLLYLKGMPPRFDFLNFVKDRLEAKGIEVKQHNSLDDAIVLREVYCKIVGV